MMQLIACGTPTGAILTREAVVNITGNNLAVAITVGNTAALNWDGQHTLPILSNNVSLVISSITNPNQNPRHISLYPEPSGCGYKLVSCLTSVSLLSSSMTNPSKNT